MLFGKEKEKLDFLEKTIQNLTKDIDDLNTEIELLKKEIEKLKNSNFYSKGKKNV